MVDSLRKHSLKHFIRQLYPSTWQEILNFLFACGNRVINHDHLRLQVTTVIVPSIDNEALQYNPMCHVREFKIGVPWEDLEVLGTPADRAVLPLTFMYSWETDLIWSWLYANCRGGAEILAIMANHSYLSPLYSLICGRFLQASGGTYGPVMDWKQWQNYFLTKGCDSVEVTWLPTACFLSEQEKTLESGLLLSPGYILKFKLPQTKQLF